jgi:hypothetical protein
MKTQTTMQADQLGRFAHFLEMHPGFCPELERDNAMVCGFHIGGCFLTITDMDSFISGEPHFAPHETMLALTAQPTMSNQKVP